MIECYAYKSISGEKLANTDVLVYTFECKVCHEIWFSCFCICPKCKKVNKFKILSGEQAFQSMIDRKNFDDMIQLSIFGLLNEEIGK